MPTLEELIEVARKIKITPQMAHEQRVSFVYGNCKIENDNITREMVEEAALRIPVDGQAPQD